MYTTQQPNLHVFQEIIKTTMPAKLPVQQQAPEQVKGEKKKKSITGIKILNENPENTTKPTKRREKGRELNTKQKKSSNKCLLTTTPNVPSLSSFHDQCHCSFCL
jgi:hypothetical protein